MARRYYSATGPTRGPSRINGREQRRAERPGPNPLYEQAKQLGDALYEDAKKLADILAPDHPVDTEELDPFDQYQILEHAAVLFSPGYWDDPDALEDLFRLRKRFTGRETQELKEFAKVARARRKRMPDIDVTPENPEFQKMMRKVGA